MSYSRGPVVHMKYSASLLPGNLSVAREAEGKGSLTYAIIHKSSVALSHVANGACRQVLVDREQREGSPRCPLLQVEKRDVTIEAGSYSVTDSLPYSSLNLSGSLVLPPIQDPPTGADIVQDL